MPDADLLAAFLADQDTHCPACDYNLRGVRTAACPECGGRLELTVVSPRAAQVWFWAAIVGFAGPFLYNSAAFVGYTWAILTIRNGTFAESVYFMAWYRGLQALGFGTIAVLFVVARAQRWQTPQIRRLVLAAAALWALSIGWFVVRQVLAMA